MKLAAIILLVLALLIGGAAIWGFSNTRLDMEVEGVRVLDAAQQQAEFDRLSSLLMNNAVRGIVYDTDFTGSSGDYVILQYTIRVRNRGLVKAEMLEAQVVPVKGDVLCYSQQEAMGQDVNTSIEAAPGQELLFRCYLLTRKDLHAVRELHVSYYIWGNPFIIKLMYG